MMILGAWPLTATAREFPPVDLSVPSPGFQRLGPIVIRATEAPPVASPRIPLTVAQGPPQAPPATMIELPVIIASRTPLVACWT